MGDFRLLSRRAVDALLELDEYNRFSKGLFSWIGFPTAVIDYRNEARQGGGGSRWTMRRLLDYGIDGVMSFNNAPLRLAVYVGTAVTALATTYVGYLVFAAVVHGIAVPGYVTLVAAVTGLGGLQLLLLGIIGEYVGRIYYEAKHRPHFVVADVSDGQRAAPRLPRQRARVPAREVQLVGNVVRDDAGERQDLDGAARRAPAERRQGDRRRPGSSSLAGAQRAGAQQAGAQQAGAQQAGAQQAGVRQDATRQHPAGRDVRGNGS